MKFRFSGPAAAVLLSLAAAGAQANTTLTVAVFPKLDQEIKDALPAWKKLHPDVDIKVSSLAIADHHNAMTTALATSSDLPDVMAVEVGFIGRFAAGGGLEDLSKAPYNAGQYKSQFIRYTFAQATTPDGAIVGMPADIGPGTLFYRKDILDKAGVTEADLNKSWDSYLAAGQKIKKATGAYLMASSRDIEDIYIRADLKEGDGVYFDKAGNPVVTSARFVTAFKLAKKARDLGLDAKITPWSNEWAESFKRGTVCDADDGRMARRPPVVVDRAGHEGSVARGQFAEQRVRIVRWHVLRDSGEGDPEADVVGIHQVPDDASGHAARVVPLDRRVPGAARSPERQLLCRARFVPRQ